MYAKVFEQILDSSLAEDYETRHVFIDLLLLADIDGAVDMTYQAIARRTNAPVELIQRAIKKLVEPDAHSRSLDHEGRRLVLLDEQREWGWRIVNYVAYRNLRDDEGRRAYMRNTMRKRRNANKNGGVLAPVSSCKHPLASVSTRKHPLAHADTEADTEAVNVSCSEPETAPASEPTSEPHVDLKELPLYATDAKLNRKWEELKAAGMPAFPGIDVLAETRKAHAWEIANPKRQKKNRAKFLYDWWARAQDRCGQQGGEIRAPPEVPPGHRYVNGVLRRVYSGVGGD